MKRRILDLMRLIWKIPILERYLVKLTIDQPFGSLVTKLPPNHYQYTKNSIRKATRHGIKYKLDLSDIVDWFIYFGFQELSRQKLYDLMKADQTIIDIGANIGDVSLHAAQFVGQTGNVHSFEPDPTNYKRFETNLDLNLFSNIHKNKVGLGDKAGTYNIANIDSGNQGMNRIVHEESSNSKTQQIQVSTLDSYVLEKKLDKVDLIKIDVEGFEYNVLKGSKTVIDTFHPTFFIELDDDNLIEQGSSANKLVKLLEDGGYEVFHAETNRKISSETNFSHCHYDIIAKHVA